MATDNIEEIKARVDVADLIQEYIQLKPAGTNSFKANCPFHNEKTPSFVVSKDKQIWHCFGCGEGGDIFSFVQKMEGIEFPEALRILAKKAGITLQYQDPEMSNRKTKLFDICKAAADFYHQILLDHPKAESVREYIKKRQLSEETVETWQIGFAPEAWDVLNKFLTQKGFSEEDIFQAGLTIKKDRGVGYNDRFRNRLMFPIWDTHGNVIGFGGRWLGKEENVAKYINTPQTIIYDKSRVLYGIDKAKMEIKKEKKVVVVEGYMDCIASHQAGVINVVASSGTALTPEQVKLIKRFTTDVIFAFDQDIAGNTAAKRGIEVAWQEEMSTKVIVLPGDAKDPDELIKEDPSLWKKAIGEAQSVMDYYFATTLDNADLENVDEKKRAAKTLLPVIAKLADSIEQTHYIQKLSAAIKVEESALRDKLGSLSTATTPAKKQEETTAKPQSDRYLTIAEVLIGLVMKNPEHLNYVIDQLLPQHISFEKLQQLYKKIIIYYTENQVFNYNDFVKTLTESENSLVMYMDVLSLKAEHEFDSGDGDQLERAVITSVRELKRHYIQQELKSIEQKLREAEESNDEHQIEEFSRRFSELTAELKRVE